MKRILLTLLILMCMTDLSSAQSSYPDSLVSINAQLPDNKEKADNYLLLTKYYRTLDYDSAWSYSEKSYTLAFKLNYPELYAEAIYIQSLLLSSQDNYQESMALNERYIHIADSLQDEKKLAKGYYNMGNLSLDLLDYDNARLNFSKSLPVYLALGDTLGILANNNAIGRIFLTQSMYDSAAVYFLRALKICEQAGESQLNNMASVIDNLCNVYFELGQYDKSLEYASKSLEIDLKYNVPDRIADDYNDLGRIYSDMGKTDEALEYYKKSRDLFLKIKDTVSISNVDNNIGVLYIDLNKPDLAIKHYDEALARYIQKDYTRGLVVVYGNKGVALSLLGRYEEAILLMEKVIDLSDKYGLSIYRQDALTNISWYWMKLGNYQKAYDYQSRSYALKDSIYDLEKTRIINDLTMKYAKQKDQARILELENSSLQKDLDLKRSTIQRNAYLFTGLGIWATALFILLYYRQKTRKDRIIAAQKIRQLEEEKKFMAARLIVEGQEEERKRIATELHDGLGVLLSAAKMQFTSIKDISPENRPIIEKATRLLEQASGDVRKISHNMMPGLLTKLGLYEAIEDLVENLAESGKIKAVCEIPEDIKRLPENTEIMIYRIIQEMVNNTLKYASAQNLIIKMTEQPGLMEISYSDDGAGFNVEEKNTSKSIGLTSIQSRVHFLNGNMDLRSEPGKGVHYKITLPL